MTNSPFNKTYCHYARQQGGLHLHYHDHAYGFPLYENDALFGRLILEINQAGLSWNTILQKQENFYQAYDQFQIEKIAHYGDADRQRLLSDAGIIRNKLKVNAAIHNAQVIVQLKEKFGSFKGWLDHHHPMEKEAWVKLFKQTFKFTGGEITNEFLMSTSYLKGAHHPDCPVHRQILEKLPFWKSNS